MFERLKRAISAARRELRYKFDTGDPALINLLGCGTSTAAGIYVTEKKATDLSSVYACKRIFSQVIGQVPLFLYRRIGENKEKAKDHPLYRLLHSSPNPQMTSFQWRQAVMGNVLMKGNQFNWIERSNAGQVLAIWPWQNNKVRTQRKGFELLYFFQTENGQEQLMPQDEVLHFRGLTDDGWIGLSPISECKETFGAALVSQEYSARFFNNNAKPALAFHYPGELKQEQKVQIKNQWEEDRTITNAHRMAILDKGCTLEKIGSNPEEAQFLETQKQRDIEISRILGLQPHMINELSRATFSNIEEMALECVIYSFGPHFVNIEQQLSLSLLTEEEREVYFFEFLVDGLLRGNVLARYQAYATGLQNAFINPDEVRERENWNEIPNGLGKIFRTPVNMQELGRSENKSQTEIPVGTGKNGGNRFQVASVDLR